MDWGPSSFLHNAVKLTRLARLTRPKPKIRSLGQMLLTTNAVAQVICNQSLPTAPRGSGCRSSQDATHALVELTLQAMKTRSGLMDRALDLHAETRTRWVADLATGPHAALQPFLADMLAKQASLETAFMVRPITLPDAQTRLESTTIGELKAGTRIGRYVLPPEVGAGGMGAVWLADRVDSALTRQVAPKLPTIHLTEALAERFARERNILVQLT